MGSLENQLGLTLVKAYRLALMLANKQLCDDIEQWIGKLNLPTLKCKRCGAPLSFFDYHLGQGYCGACYELEDEEDEQLEH